MLICIKTLRSSDKNEEKLTEHLNKIYDAAEKRQKEIRNGDNTIKSLRILEKYEREPRADLGKRKPERKRESRWRKPGRRWPRRKTERWPGWQEKK